MTLFTLVRGNLFRNKLRSGLTVAAVALPLTLFLLITSVRHVLDDYVKISETELRLIVCHRASFAIMLPIRLRREIEYLDPRREALSAVTSFRWFEARVAGAPPLPFACIAMDTDTGPDVFRERGINREAWLSAKNAAVVAEVIANHFGWRVGQDVELTSTYPPYQKVRFRIVQVYARGNDILFRREYLDEELKRSGGAEGETNVFFVRCRRADRMADLAGRIDERFANHPHETRTQEEKVFMADMLRSMGDFPGKLQIVGFSVILAVVLVVANTMSLSLRERVRELAVFKTLGFGPGWIARLLLAEGFLLTAAGLMIGPVPAYLFFRLVEVNDIGFGPMPRFFIPDRTLVQASAAAAFVALASGLPLAWSAARMKVVEALRRV